MERFLVVLFALFSLPCFSAVPGNAPILCMAASGQNTQSLCIPLSSLSATGPSKVFSLFCSGTGTAGHFYPCYLDGVAYKAGNSTGSGTPKAYCYNFTVGFPLTNNTFQMVSSTNAITYDMSPLTGTTKYQGGAAAVYPVITGPVAYVPASVPGSYVFDNAAFVGFQGQNAGNGNYQIQLQCSEAP